jgi:flagellar basal body-associated protein FliL
MAAKNAAAPNAAAPAEEAAAPKSKKKTWVIGGVVALLALVGGAATPMFAHFGAQASSGEPEAGPKHSSQQAIIPFDSPVVNVSNGRYEHYLRVKIALVVDAKDEKAIKEALEKEKQFLQTWVLGYLQDRTMEQLHGSAGMNRVRRELRDEFNRRLFPDGPDKIRDILLPEYNFQ